MATGVDPSGDSTDVETLVRTYGSHIVTPRWVACLLDYVVLFAALMFAHWACQGLPIVVPWSLWLGVAALYFIVPEAMWGVSLGKLHTKIVVVDRHGNPPGTARALVRFLLRLVEINPLLCGGLPAGLLASLTPQKQRLGDMLAGTYVVYRDDLEAIKRVRAEAVEIHVGQ